jgi:hypothetical protein
MSCRWLPQVMYELGLPGGRKDQHSNHRGDGRTDTPRAGERSATAKATHHDLARRLKQHRTCRPGELLLLKDSKGATALAMCRYMRRRLTHQFGQTEGL